MFSLWGLFVLSTGLAVADSKYSEGFLKTPEKWAFLERFCFLSEDGSFSFEIEYDLKFAVLNLLLYFDTASQWAAVYKSEKTCEEKESVMKRENNQVINLTLLSSSSECEIVRIQGQEPAYRCKGTRTFISARERWWFIAVSNCNTSNGIEMKYRLTLTNGFSFWVRHFSADEFYILQTDLVAFGVELALLLLSIFASTELKARQLLHTTYRLYMAAIVCQVCGLGLLVLHYAQYAYDGIGFPLSKLCGRVYCSISTIVSVFFLLLMAKGFNITRGRLRQASAIRLTIFMCLFCVVYVVLFVYEQQFFDPGEVLYIYDSPAGYGLVILRCVGWLMFLYACFFTVKHYPDKHRFYYPFFIFYTLWFVSGPVMVIISNHVIDKWVREKVINGIDLGITALGHTFFLFLTRPNVANKNFPYHVRTSQITSLHTASTEAPADTMDAFNAYAYAPDNEDEQKNYASADLFLVSGAMEMRPIRAPRTTFCYDDTFPCGHSSPAALFAAKLSPNSHQCLQQGSTVPSPYTTPNGPPFKEVSKPLSPLHPEYNQ